MELGPRVRRLGNDIIAAYLVEADGGLLLVDAGLAGHWHDLTAALGALGRSPEDIGGVVLTHGDTDHLGFAERLRRDHGVPVHVHPADAARARGETKPRASWGRISPGPTARLLWYGARKGGLRTAYLTEVRDVGDGDVLDLPGAPRIIGVPGHSPGSIAVHVPAADAVFVGDALTTRHVLTGRRGPQPAPFTDDPGQALTSLQRLAGLGATWVLPGHGPPWSGGTEEAVRLVHAAAGRRSDA